jgi:hypothetical protein
MTVIEIRPYRNGWKVFEAPGIFDTNNNQVATDTFTYVSPDNAGALEWRGYHFDTPVKTITYHGDFVVTDGMQVLEAQTRCPHPQGYWKTNPALWPVSSLVLGSQTYSETELLNILNTAVGSGGKADATLALADQLIGAKLNIANGSDPAPVSSTITDADSLLSAFSGKLPYKVKPSSATGQKMVNDGTTLDNYNSGLLTPVCTP